MVELIKSEGQHCFFQSDGVQTPVRFMVLCLNMTFTQIRPSSRFFQVLQFSNRCTSLKCICRSCQYFFCLIFWSCLLQTSSCWPPAERSSTAGLKFTTPGSQRTRRGTPIQSSEHRNLSPTTVWRAPQRLFLWSCLSLCFSHSEWNAFCIFHALGTKTALSFADWRWKYLKVPQKHFSNTSNSFCITLWPQRSLIHLIFLSYV